MSEAIRNNQPIPTPEGVQPALTAAEQLQFVDQTITPTEVPGYTQLVDAGTAVNEVLASAQKVSDTEYQAADGSYLSADLVDSARAKTDPANWKMSPGETDSTYRIASATSISELTRRDTADFKDYKSSLQPGMTKDDAFQSFTSYMGNRLKLANAIEDAERNGELSDITAVDIYGRVRRPNGSYMSNAEIAAVEANQDTIRTGLNELRPDVPNSPVEQIAQPDVAHSSDAKSNSTIKKAGRRATSSAGHRSAIGFQTVGLSADADTGLGKHFAPEVYPDDAPAPIGEADLAGDDSWQAAGADPIKSVGASVARPATTTSAEQSAPEAPASESAETSEPAYISPTYKSLTDIAEFHPKFGMPLNPDGKLMSIEQANLLLANQDTIRTGLNADGSLKTPDQARKAIASEIAAPGPDTGVSGAASPEQSSPAQGGEGSALVAGPAAEHIAEPAEEPTPAATPHLKLTDKLSLDYVSAKLAGVVSRIPEKGTTKRHIFNRVLGAAAVYGAVKVGIDMDTVNNIAGNVGGAWMDSSVEHVATNLPDLIENGPDRLEEAAAHIFESGRVEDIEDNGITDLANAMSEAAAEEPTATDSFTTESLTHSGDTMSHHIAAGLQPGEDLNQEIQEALDFNGMTPEDPRHMAIGQEFNIPADAAGQEAGQTMETAADTSGTALTSETTPIVPDRRDIIEMGLESFAEGSGAHERYANLSEGNQNLSVLTLAGVTAAARQRRKNKKEKKRAKSGR